MSERALRPANVAAAAVVIGGVLITVLPRYALSIVQIVIVSAAVSAAVYALATRVPRTGWISPFRWLSPFSGDAHARPPVHRSRMLELIRARLSARRQHVDGAPPLPPAVLRRLKALVASALDLDLRDERRLAAARARVSPLTFAILTAEPLERPSWIRMTRPDPREVAETVHRVLDDLDRLTPG